MNKVLCWLVCVLIVSSCTKNQKPDNLIAEDQMIIILTDLHKADALLMQSVNRKAIESKTTPGFYIDLFKKHEITKAQFDSSYSFYCTDYKNFEKMYDHVLANLQQELDSVQTNLKKE